MSNWIVMPFLNCWEMTKQAVEDCLVQNVTLPGGRPRILLISNGSDASVHEEVRRWCSLPKQKDRVLPWLFSPGLLSLSGVWNRALDFCWETGASEALVVNNDVRLNPLTYQKLLLVMAAANTLFVSAVGVRQEQFTMEPADYFKVDLASDRGGPDFSCFLISKDCHSKYRFDEAFIPCYCEDLDYHRRLMLGGDGHRIFSINVPFLHLSSQTLKQLPPDKAAAISRRINEVSRAHYREKWGGDCNGETFLTPFGPDKPHGVCVTTPQLQAHGCGGVGCTGPGGGALRGREDLQESNVDERQND